MAGGKGRGEYRLIIFIQARQGFDFLPHGIFSLNTLLGLCVCEAVFEEEGVLEEVRRTPGAAVLRLQHPRHCHVLLLQVHQQRLVGSVPETYQE